MTTSQTPGRGGALESAREENPGPVPEITDLGPCPECGQRRHRIAMCLCGHMVMEHGIGTRKGVDVRTACSNHRCDCKLYTAAEVPT